MTQEFKTCAAFSCFLKFTQQKKKSTLFFSLIVQMLDHWAPKTVQITNFYKTKELRHYTAYFNKNIEKEFPKITIWYSWNFLSFLVSRNFIIWLEKNNERKRTSDGNGRVIDAKLVELQWRQSVPETLVHRALKRCELKYGFATAPLHDFSTAISCLPSSSSSSSSSFFFSCFWRFVKIK